MSFPEYLPDRLSRGLEDATAAPGDTLLTLGAFAGGPGLTTMTYAGAEIAPSPRPSERLAHPRHLRLVHDANWRPSTTGDRWRWRRYLDELSLEPVQLPMDHARAVRRVWHALNSSVGHALRAPSAGPSGALGFQLSWNTDRFYLDIDIAPDGRFEWFWTDRSTDAYQGSDDERLTTPPEALVRLLVRFCLDR